MQYMLHGPCLHESTNVFPSFPNYTDDNENTCLGVQLHVIVLIWNIFQYGITVEMLQIDIIFSFILCYLAFELKSFEKKYVNE